MEIGKTEKTEERKEGVKRNRTGGAEKGKKK